MQPACRSTRRSDGLSQRLRRAASGGALLALVATAGPAGALDGARITLGISERDAAESALGEAEDFRSVRPRPGPELSLDYRPPGPGVEGPQPQFGWEHGGLLFGGKATYLPLTAAPGLGINPLTIDTTTPETLGLSGFLANRITPEALVFGRADYHRRRYDDRLSVFSEEDWLDDLRLGAGAEFRLWEHSTLRLEFSRTWYGDERASERAAERRDRSGENWFEAGGILRF